MKNKKRNLFKEKTKIIAILLIVMLFPIFALSGCTGQRDIVFETEATNLEVMNFYNANIRTKQKEFINYVDEEYENDLDNLDSEEQSQYTSSISLIQNLQNKIYIILPALDFYLSYDPDNPDEKGQYNLTDEELGIGYFELIKGQSSGTSKSYYKELSGSDENTYLPAIKNSGNEEFEDSVEDIIKSWGNHLNFEISYYSATKTYKIIVKSEFSYPDNLEETNSDGIKIKRYDSLNKIAIVYEESGVTYSKVVEFTASGTSKKVTKYTGDYTENNAAQVGTYNYVYEEASPYGSVTGTYEIKFVQDASYINVKYTKDSQYPGNYYIFESYALSGDIIVTRIHKILGVKTEVYDICITAGISGKLKKYEVAQVARIEDLSKINANEFGIITNAEKTNISYKKISFVIDRGGLSCENVGYVS